MTLRQPSDENVCRCHTVVDECTCMDVLTSCNHTQAHMCLIGLVWYIGACDSEGGSSIQPLKLKPENDTGTWGKLEYRDDVCRDGLEEELHACSNRQHHSLEITLFHDFHLQLYDLEPSCASDI